MIAFFTTPPKRVVFALSITPRGDCADQTTPASWTDRGNSAPDADRAVGSMRNASALIVLAALVPGCADSGVLTSANEHELRLTDALADADRMVIWKRTVTTDEEGRTAEDVWVTDDPVLVSRLDDLAAEGYYDPEVDVRLEDFAWGSEDGRSVSGSELILERRHKDDAGEVAAAIEHATGVPFDEWERRRAERIAALPSPDELIEREIQAARQAGEDTSELVVRLGQEPTTVVPRRLSALLPRSELEYLDRDLERAEAMARRGQEILELQQAFVAWAEDQGAEVLGRTWIDNTLTLAAPASLLRAIAARPEVASAHRAGPIVAEANFPLDVVRSGIQVQPFLDAGYDGDRTSSRNAHGIWLGILEVNDSLSTNHDGWKTNANQTRVQGTWQCNEPPAACGPNLSACETLHGMAVASIATADFLDGQTPGMSQSDQQRRSGIAQEASVWLATTEAEAPINSYTSWNNAVQKAIQDNVDVVNSSAGAYECDPGDAWASPVNSAYDDGIIWVNSLGNAQVCHSDHCTANHQSAAYGSIAVAGTDAFDDGSFDDPRLCENNGTADGRAPWGLIADLAAPAGFYQPMDCVNGFQPAGAFCAGTSLSAPHVAGAVTLLKDFWISAFGDASAQSPGRMHSAMLLMGDGCSYVGLDGRWGAGRLRMRKFDNPGMDAPWRVRIASTTLANGNSVVSFDVNPDAQNVNQAVPDDADALVVTAFCKVANPKLADLTTALNLYDWDRHDWPPVDRAFPGEKARIGMSPEAHRYTATLIVSGIDYFEQVPCWVHILFEDKDRDDADGPPASIEPYYVDDPYGQGQAARPADCIPAGWCP